MVYRLRKDFYPCKSDRKSEPWVTSASRKPVENMPREIQDRLPDSYNLLVIISKYLGLYNMEKKSHATSNDFKSASKTKTGWRNYDTTGLKTELTVGLSWPQKGKVHHRSKRKHVGKETPERTSQFTKSSILKCVHCLVSTSAYPLLENHRFLSRTRTQKKVPD